MRAIIVKAIIVRVTVIIVVGGNGGRGHGFGGGCRFTWCIVYMSKDI
jgi:hypothetical protein